MTLPGDSLDALLPTHGTGLTRDTRENGTFCPEPIPIGW